MKIQYPASITKMGGEYLVRFPDFAEALTDGITLEEALFNAAEVLTVTLEGRVAEGIKIPSPTPPKGKIKYQPLLFWPVSRQIFPGAGIFENLP